MRVQLTLQRSDEPRERVLVAGPCGIHQFRLHSTHATTPRPTGARHQFQGCSAALADPADVENFLGDRGRRTHVSGPIAQELM
jgi:hypothetical protein